MITKDQAQGLAERLDLSTDLVAWGYGGSRMYGLHTEDSDYDVVLVTSDLKPGVEIHADMGNQQDVWAMSLGSYMQGVGACKPNYAILSFASTMHWNDRSPVYTVAKMQGINMLGVMDSLSRHAKSDVHVFCSRPLGDFRGNKCLKVAIRNTILIRKLLRWQAGNGGFLVTFPKLEKDMLYSTIEKAQDYHGMPAHVCGLLHSLITE